MSKNIEKCNFCGNAVKLEHELLWDLNSFGTWCGDCGGGLDFIGRSVQIMEIIARATSSWSSCLLRGTRTISSTRY